MSAISKNDLKTILTFAIHLAKVDDEFHLMEKKVLRRMSEAIGLSDDERQAMVDRDVSLSSGLDSLSSEPARDLLMKFLCVVSFVDGHTSPEEVSFIEKVLAKFGGESIFLLPKEEWGGYEEEVFEKVSEVH